MISKNNNETKHCWNAHCPFCKDSIDRDNGTLTLTDVARRLVKAHESEAEGLFVGHDHKKLENESWNPARKHNKKSKKQVSGTRTTNLNQSHYDCPSGGHRCFRFER